MVRGPWSVVRGPWSVKVAGIRIIKPALLYMKLQDISFCFGAVGIIGIPGAVGKVRRKLMSAVDYILFFIQNYRFWQKMRKTKSMLLGTTFPGWTACGAGG